ncbi:Cytoskeleton-associated protein 5 isoform a [Trichuris trichiura]|uniref:Cytoskeleton-associated protein 5 isoform a n=1 Tax=Trichuris trichiura TaxID=36087 RepID=A0A077YZQ6_TRITR|nr:Cytoskeleton-associated protein 5 isoform a [Trichuris trichiura]
MSLLLSVSFGECSTDHYENVEELEPCSSNQLCVLFSAWKINEQRQRFLGPLLEDKELKPKLVSVGSYSFGVNPDYHYGVEHHFTVSATVFLVRLASGGELGDRKVTMAGEGEVDFSKLPLEELLIHKNWKARSLGYDNLLKKFASGSGENEPVFAKYAPFVKGAVLDSNISAMEKGLEVVYAFVDQASLSNKLASDLCAALVENCLIAPRRRSVERAQEILLLCVEVEKQEAVSNALVAGLQNKKPKIVAGSVVTTTTIVRDFGIKNFSVKPFIKLILPLLEHRDKEIRDYSKQFVIELYKWCGAALKTQLQSVRPILLAELEEEFSKISGQNATPTRCLRSERKLSVAQASADESAHFQQEEQSAEPEKVDMWEMLDPVNVLAKLPNEFFETLKSPKWLERKDVLELLVKLMVENPRLDPNAQYGELVAVLKNIISKDSNVNVVAVASKCLAHLASGLRKKFSSFAIMCYPVVLGRLKERKPVVVNALVEAVDAISKTVSFDSIAEETVKALSNKSPGVKVQTALFIGRYFSTCSSAVLNKKNLKIVVGPLAKTISESDPEVRDSAATALASIWNAAGEGTIKPLLGEVADDHLKMKKIKDLAEKQKEEEGAKPQVTVSKAAPVVQEAPKPSAPTKVRIVKPQSESQKVVQKPKAEVVGKTEEELTDEEVNSQVSIVIDDSLLQSYDSTIWKDRLAALEQIVTTVKGLNTKNLPVQALVRYFVKRHENNFQIQSLKFELYCYLAQKGPNFGVVSFRYCLGECMEKFSDPKLTGHVLRTLTACVEALSISLVADESLRAAMEQKNPKTQAESFSWLSEAIQEFGAAVDLPSLATHIRKGLSATSPVVRAAAVELVGILFWFRGSEVKMMFQSEKSAVLQMIEKQMSKFENCDPPKPRRASNPEQPITEEEALPATSGSADLQNDEEEAQPVIDDMAKQDITDLITDDLVAELEDKNWKVRLAALDKVQAIIVDSKCISSRLGPLPSILKQRLGDSNKSIAQSALNVCQAIAVHGGPSIKEHVRIIGSAILGILSDSKPATRQNALRVLNTWVENAGFKEFLTSEIIPNALKSDSPVLRTEVLSWLSSNIETTRERLPDGDLKLCLPLTFAFLEDRNPDVRRQAQSVLLPFMNASSAKNVKELLAKLRPNAVPINPPEQEKKVPCRSDAGSKLNQRAGAGVRHLSSTKDRSSEGTSDASSSCCLSLVSPSAKQQRFHDEKALRILKWQFATPSSEHVDQLKVQMATVCKGELLTLLFSAEMKHQLKAIELLMQAICQCPESALNSLDLILKWCTLRFFETNPSVLIKCLELIQSLLRVCVERQYTWHEYELGSFLPFLLLKLGEQKEAIRTTIRQMLDSIVDLSSADRVFPHLMESCKAKNSRLRAECLCTIGALIETYGVSICGSPQVALKAIAQYISDRDNAVRNAALNSLVSAHMHIGEKLYKFVSPLSSKDMSMLEERIRRSNKVLGTPVKPPPPVNSSTIRLVKPVASNPNHDDANGVVSRETIEPMPTPKKRFEWDKEELGFDPYEDLTVPFPELIDHSDTDEIVKRPFVYEFRSHLYKQQQRHPEVEEPSGDISSALDAVINQVASRDLSSSVVAVCQLQEVINDPVKCFFLRGKVDRLLTVIYFQLQLAQGVYLIDNTADVKTIIALYKAVCNILLATVRMEELMNEATDASLKDLVGQLLTTLCDNRFETVEEFANVKHSINMYVMKLIANCNPTICIVALLRLLRETLQSQSSSDTLLQLVLKCIWKWSGSVPKFVGKLELSRLLLEAHTFFVQFPPSYWSSGSVPDVPCRTVKTIVHLLVKHLGAEKLLAHTNLIDNPERSEAIKYVKKCDNILRKSQQSNKNAAEAGQSPSAQSPAESKLVSTEPWQERLKDILSRVGNKVTCKEALVELRAFKASNPTVDLRPYMQSFGTAFQSFINRHLQSDDDQPSVSAGSSCSAEVFGHERESENSFQSHNYETIIARAYHQRLLQLRKESGLGDLAASNSLASRTDSRNSSGADSVFSSGLARMSNSSNLESLRRRLEAVKGSCSADGV